MDRTSGILSASLEDYLEAIFHIIEEKGAVRGKDISKMLKVKSPSVTAALRQLAARELVRYAPYDVITLTPQGRKVARDVIRRHEVLKDFFVKFLSIEEKLADEGACNMEHSVPREILERLIQLVEFIETCPRGGATWIKGFGYYCKQGVRQDGCERCMTLCLEEHRAKGGRRGDGPRPLSELASGQRGRVLKVAARGEARKKIVKMGMTPGAVIDVENVALRGDSIDVKVRGYHLSLRKDEAAGVHVQPMKYGEG